MSINKVILIGYCGQEPSIRSMPDGKAVANFSVATSRRLKDGSDDTEWHRCSAYERVAEIVQQYVHKGSHVYVEGRTKTKKYTTKDGTPRESTEVIVGHIQVLDKRASTPADEQPSLKDLDDDVPF